MLYKDEDKDERGNPAIGPDGKPRYRCGFRIGGGIDQDNTKSPQGYPDKVYQCGKKRNSARTANGADKRLVLHLCLHSKI